MACDCNFFLRLKGGRKRNPFLGETRSGFSRYSSDDAKAIVLDFMNPARR
jgi:hypothetical protein